MMHYIRRLTGAPSHAMLGSPISTQGRQLCGRASIQKKKGGALVKKQNDSRKMLVFDREDEKKDSKTCLQIDQSGHSTSIDMHPP